MFNITSHQRSVNQNYNETTSYKLGWLLLKTKQKTGNKCWQQ